MAADWCRCALNTCPRTDPAVPPNDGVQHARIVLDLCFLKHDGFLDTCTCADDNFGTNGDVGTEFRSWVDLRRGVNEDWGHDLCRGLGNLWGLLLESLLQIQCIGRHS